MTDQKATIQYQNTSDESLIQALARERNVLRAVMAHTPTQIAYLDYDLNFVMVNQAYEKGAGLSREQLIGANHFDLFPDDENRTIFERVRDTGEPETFVAKPFAFPQQPERGVTYWDWTLAPVKDDRGAVQGLILSLLDVTQQHLNTAKIADLARFPSENPFPVLRVARDGTLLYANESSRPLLDYWNVEEGDQIPRRWREHVAETLRSQTSYAAEIRYHKTSYILKIEPIRLGERLDDSYANLYGIDITDLRHTQRSLRQYTNRLSALHQIDQAILSAESMEAIAEVTLSKLPEMVNFSHASVMLFDFEAGTCSLLAAASRPEDTRLAKGWAASLDVVGREQLDTLSQGDAIVIRQIDLDREPVSAMAEMLLTDNAGALIQQPMIVQGELIGVFNLCLPASKMLTSSLTELAHELGIQLAIAIQQARLHRQVEEYTTMLEQRVAWRTAALRISEARFRAIFEDAPMGIALLDNNGQIIQCNATLAKILRLDTLSVIDTSLFSYMPEEDAATVRQHYDDLMRGVAASHRTEFRITSVPEQTIWCMITLSLVRDAGCQPRLAISIIEDITEQREAQVALVQTEKLALTGQMAASLAHEINNPLQTVIGCLGLAEESLEMHDHQVDMYLSMASQELKRAASIVGRLRDLNRKSTEDEREPVDLRTLVEQVLLITQKQCRDRDITITLQLLHQNAEPKVMTFPDADETRLTKATPREAAVSDGEYVINVVPGRIHQVFLNLVLNAIDAMPQGGALTVTLQRSPGDLHIAFQDTGVGMSREVQERLFNPFYTTKSEGLGLGLYISQSIIDDHNGHIEVESVPGEGTTFNIWLPGLDNQ